MRRALPTIVLLIIVALDGPLAASVPELMERAVLPYTAAPPTCACTVP